MRLPLLLLLAAPAAAAPSETLERAAALSAKHQENAALAALKEAEKEKLDTLQLIRLSQLYQDLRQYCASADAAERALKSGGDSLDAGLLRYADGAAFCGRRGEAKKAIEDFLALGSKDPKLLDQASYLAEFIDEYRLALKASDALLAAGPADVWHLLRRHRIAIWAREPAEAEKALAAAASASPGAFDAFRIRYAMPSVPKPGPALDAARRGLDAHLASAKDAKSLTELAELYRKLGDEATAAALRARRPKGTPEDLEDALARLQRGDKDAADAALALAGEHPDLRERVASALGELGDRRALPLFEALRSGKMKDYGLMRAHADALAACGDCAEFPMRRELLKDEPGDGEYLFAYARAALRCGKREEGLDTLRGLALTSDPDLGRRTARLLQDGRDLAAALKLYDELVAKAPADAGLRAERGVARHLAGAPGAEDDLKEALRLDPKNADAQRSLDALGKR